jgi:hypothetical protein
VLLSFVQLDTGRYVPNNRRRNLGSVLVSKQRIENIYNTPHLNLKSQCLACQGKDVDDGDEARPFLLNGVNLLKLLLKKVGPHDDPAI